MKKTNICSGIPIHHVGILHMDNESFLGAGFNQFAAFGLNQLHSIRGGSKKYDLSCSYLFYFLKIL
jgi:hypothetical protein